MMSKQIWVITGAGRGMGVEFVKAATPTDVDATVYQLNADGAELVMFFLRVGDHALRLLDREQREIHSTANYTLTLTTAAASR
jgi:hypothetical protein